MQLTSHTDFALRLLIYLAVQEEHKQATVHDAAERYGISTNHLAKVAQKLVQLGYINSHRGRGGGLELAMAPEKINIGRLVRATESLQLVECFGANSTCPIEPGCTLKSILSDAQKAFLKVLDGYSLADLTQQNKKDRLAELLEMPA